MLKHLFKLIWNKKRQNFLLISEIFVSFLVIFAVFTLMVYNFRNYNKPMGLDYENVWVVNYNNPSMTKNADSLSTFCELLRQTIKSMPDVRQISFSSDNIPFSQNSMEGAINEGGKTKLGVNMYHVEDSYQETLNMKLVEGRWFSKQDAVFKSQPVVINETLREQLFGNGNGVGKFINEADNKNKMKVIGVVTDVKTKGDYAASGPAIYYRIDSNFLNNLGKILIKVTPGANAAFEGSMYKTLANYMKNANVEIEHLTDKRKSINYFTLVPMIVLLIVAGFLIINVALGLFGVLWYNINKRKAEIALRRAVGASGNSVSGQLVGESLIIASLSLTIGTFFAIQFPLLNVFDLPSGVYLLALLCSLVFIYLLVLICSLYPGRQAAAIYPAAALHED
jgi:putative ABC transport system permease protein